MDSTSLTVACAGIIVLLSWIGLGWAAQRTLQLQHAIRGHWSFDAAFGAAIVLVIGGITTTLQITSVVSLAVITLLGILLSPFALRSQRPILRNLWSFPFLAFGIVLFLAAAQSSRTNVGDDLQAYLVFPKQLLESRTLLAPFNMRRLGAYGGQQLLQAQILAVVQLIARPSIFTDALLRGHLLDDGLCTLIAAGILRARIRPKTPSQHFLALLVVATFLLMPVPRVNTHAQASGTMLFLALGYCLPALSFRMRWQSALTAGLLAAGVATLRMNFAAGAAIALMLTAMQAMRRNRTLLAIRLAALPLVVMLAAISPWAMVLYRSSGTPFYPLLHGYQKGAFLQASMAIRDHLEWSTVSVLYPKFLLTFFPLALAFLLRRRRDVLPLYAGAIVMTATLAWSFTNQETSNLYRLSSPMLIACAWLVFAAIPKRIKRLTPAVRVAGIMMLVAIPITASYEFSDSFRHSYSLWLLLILVLCMGAPAFPRAITTIAWPSTMFVLLGCCIANRSRLAENGILFLFAASITTLIWIAWAARYSPFRIITLVAAGLLAVIAFIERSSIEGIFPLASLLILTAAGFYLAVQSTRPRTRAHAVRIAIATLLFLVLGFFNMGFIVDHFAPALLLAAIAAAGWIVLHAPARLTRLISMIAITAIFLAAVPTIYVLYDSAFWLPAAFAAVALAFVCTRIQISLPRALIPALLIAACSILIPQAAAIKHSDPSFAYPAELLDAYHRAQSLVPVNAPIFAFVTEPACLDFRRNRIQSSDDQIQFVSPPPGVPLCDSPSSLRDYFHKLGIRYVLLSPDHLARNQFGLPQTLRDNLLALQSFNPLLFQSSHLVLIDLES